MVFCSKSCHYKWRKESKTFSASNNPNWKEKVDLKCKFCNKPFKRLACNMRDGNQFCSKSCSDKWRKTIRGKDHWLYKEVDCICEICKKSFKTKPRWSKARFCSQQCNSVWFANYASIERVGENHPNWKGGAINYRGSNWVAQARKARKRDNYICQNCGISQKELKRRLDVHHIIPFREFGLDNYKKANRLKNLISLCPTCHNYAEWAYTKENKNESVTGVS
jgi:hypothetical protein